MLRDHSRGRQLSRGQWLRPTLAWSAILGVAACASCALLGFSTPVDASFELTQRYERARPDLIQGYLNSDNPVIQDYVNWRPAATGPAKTGVHGGRLLMTYVNDIGYDAYVEYAPGGVEMPIGTKIVKESFTKSGDELRPGPLFMMEKVGLVEAPGTAGWYYSRFKANGDPNNTSQSFCHSCHKPYKDQDFLGYPARSARFGYVKPTEVALPVEPTSPAAVGDMRQGKQEFSRCTSCHEVGEDAEHGFGPTLNGIVGRRAGGAAGYTYSQSLVRAGEGGLVWDESTLFDWLGGPSSFLQRHLGDADAESKMPISFDDPAVRRNVIAYLATLKGS